MSWFQKVLQDSEVMTPYEKFRLVLQVIQLIATILVPFVIIFLNKRLNGC